MVGGELKRRARRRRAAVTGALAALGLVGAAGLAGVPGASAASGDKVLALSAGNAEIATDRCIGASLSVSVNGAPGVPDDYTALLSSPNKPCAARARYVALTAKRRRPFRTPYVGFTAGGDGTGPTEGAAVGVKNKIYRCWVEMGVKRRNGSYFTVILKPSGFDRSRGETKGCPRPPDVPTNGAS